MYFFRLEGSLEKTISELHHVIENMKPGILSYAEIYEEIIFTQESIPYIFPSSVHQFWKILDGRVVANYRGSDISLLL